MITISSSHYILNTHLNLSNGNIARVKIGIDKVKHLFLRIHIIWNTYSFCIGHSHPSFAVSNLGVHTMHSGTWKIISYW